MGSFRERFAEGSQVVDSFRTSRTNTDDDLSTALHCQPLMRSVPKDYSYQSVLGIINS